MSISRPHPSICLLGHATSLDGGEVVADPHYSNINETGLLLAYEMAGRWVGPMPVSDFIKTFLPDTPGSEELPLLTADSFEMMFKESSETARYTPFIKATEYLMPDFVGVNTSAKPEEVELLKTDVAFYLKDGEDIPTRTDFSKMELWVEFKKGSADPFQDPPKPSKGASDEPLPFTPETQEARMTRGQLATYAIAINAHQFRHFSFSIFINDKQARFFRWDPAGVIVSALFNFCDNPDILAKFLWRFAHLSAAQRGHDTSVREIDLSSDIAERVRNGLGIQDVKTKLYKYDLPACLAGKGHAYGPFPPLPSHSLVARCTRTLPVLFIPEAPAQDENVTNQSDPGSSRASKEPSPFEKEGVIFLKDTWRRLSTDPDKKVMAEHETYEMLHAKNTPHIPEHVAGGDVHDTSGGETRTQDFLDAEWRTTWNVFVAPFQHYRLVLGVVGRPLTKFSSTKELVQAMCDVMIAHWHAYDIVKILHRDISVGNIIITSDGRGLLIDWEMGKKVEEVGPGRTGTWQFMSAALLKDPSKTHTLADDLESFIHIMGWLILRYIPSVNFPDSHRSARMLMFDEVLDIDQAQGPSTGGVYKETALASGIYPAAHFQFKRPTPLSTLLRDLCSPFRTLYSKPPMINDPPKANKHLKTPQGLLLSQLLVENYNENIERLKSSTWFIDTISTALDEEAWPEDDGADHTVFKPSKGLLTELQERLRTSSLKSSQEAFSATKGSGRSNKRAAEDPIAEEVIQSRKRLRVT